jgi:orotate phosphoribosyltransferase
MTQKFRHASYLDAAFRPDLLDEILSEAKKKLREIQFDAIAFCGMSGALFAPLLAHQMNKYLLLARKPEDSSHSRLPVEGYYAAKTYVIVDDFCASGDTLHFIHNAIQSQLPNAKCVGVYLYNWRKFHADYFGDLSRPERTEDKPGKSEVAADESVSSITLSGDLFKSIWGPVLNSAVLSVDPASGLSTTTSAVTSRK